MTDTTSLPEADVAAPAQPAAASTPDNPYAAPRAADPAASGTSNGFSIASLVLGIAAIPTGWWIASVIAIVFGFVARGREPQGRTMANWGIALGFVGAFGWIVLAILGLAFVAPFALWGAAVGWGPDIFGF